MAEDHSVTKKVLATAGAVVEIAVLFLASAIFMRWCANTIGLDSYRAIADAWEPGKDVPWSRLAIHETIRHALRYGPLFTIAFVWGYYIFKFGPRDYGLTLASTPIWKHLAWGVGLFLVIGLPTKLIINYMKDFSRMR